MKYWDSSALVPLCVDEASLRASDAVQLSAAVAAADREPAGLQVVSLDERLAAVARREGFTVLGAPIA